MASNIFNDFVFGILGCRIFLLPGDYSVSISVYRRDLVIPSLANLATRRFSRVSFRSVVIEANHYLCIERPKITALQLNCHCAEAMKQCGCGKGGDERRVE